MWKQLKVLTASSYVAVPIIALVAVGVVCSFYVKENWTGQGEPLALSDGASAWPSIAIIVFAGLLSVHLIMKTYVDLEENASSLGKEFRLDGIVPWTTRFFGWEAPPTATGRKSSQETIDIEALWLRYVCRGRLPARVFRVAPMTLFYVAAFLIALFTLRPLTGDPPRPPIRGDFPYFHLIILITVISFLFLTFFVIDAILLHKGFLVQLQKYESIWPEVTFEEFEYDESVRANIKLDLADYWDILLISKRTEAVGRLIYYPFLVFSLLIVARLSCFDDWVWTPVLISALSMHFSLALYAAWQLPKVAREYRDCVLERLQRRRRQALMLPGQTAEAIKSMIEEIETTHQGAFSYLWEQPAIRALLLPSGGIGLATLLQYLPH